MDTTGSKLTNLSDTDLVRLAIEQNQAAYIVLYTRYNPGVRSHISRYVAQKEDIEDICLESFQKAFSQIGSYNPEYKFSTLSDSENIPRSSQTHILIRQEKSIVRFI